MHVVDEREPQLAESRGKAEALTDAFVADMTSASILHKTLRERREKLNIPPQRFFAMIQWLRKLTVIPKVRGTAAGTPGAELDA